MAKKRISATDRAAERQMPPATEINLTGVTALRLVWLRQMYAATLRAPVAGDGATLRDTIEKQAGRVALLAGDQAKGKSE